ncbi:DUF1624 domain-containing protein [Lacibacter sp.]|uniref:DUF1624 domain-containing protein n=1 Tax=Lacibacter sp. TaxID=1915409 RepID=UPI002B4AC830|nr:heparan-alpha-glucosaminide N-acetyltransferase domain-containing protein [Lacibacter sp.]HLP39470.1 heparan-alpha-glucosaminide N-acetyltransferase domain-containing protein [Lacibacter sp.]
MNKSLNGNPTLSIAKSKRIQSIDLLRGIVMIIMALDHVRNFFHYDAFFYNPTDLTQTNASLFFTRIITHYCAPVFIFLAGMSAYLYGEKRSKKELSFFLLTRGIWLVLAEIFIVGMFRSFNPSYHYLNFQVIWAIGFCMIILAALIHMNRLFILVVGLLLIGTHNLLDSVHVAGNGWRAVLWAILHDVNHFTFGQYSFHFRYPVLPWIGVMASGYCMGMLYSPDYPAATRRKILCCLGISAIALFILLRSGNFYGDGSSWSTQKNSLFSVLSFLNVTKYPPSLLYLLITLGPAMIFLAVSEKPLRVLGQRISIFGRVPMFYYLAHILLIKILAIMAALLMGYPQMIVLSNGVNATPELKGYGFNLAIVYEVWIGLVLLLYPVCKWFDSYKRANQLKQSWLSYL